MKFTTRLAESLLHEGESISVQFPSSATRLLKDPHFQGYSPVEYMPIFAKKFGAKVTDHGRGSFEFSGLRSTGDVAKFIKELTRVYPGVAVEHMTDFEY